MATLDIGGRKVTVDDNFLKLSPQEQQRTVDEIAQSLGITKPSPSPGYVEDIAKGTGTGIGQGVISLMGLPADAGRAIGRGMTYGIDRIMGYSPEEIAQRQADADQAMNASLLPAPTSQAITSAVEGVTGPFYQAQTVPGQFAQTGGQFLPGALLGPGSAAAKAGGWLGGSLLSEGAGQLTKDYPSIEPYARLASGILGSMAGGMAGSKLAGTAPPPAVALKELDDLQAAKNAAYARADQAGIAYTPQAVDDLMASIDNALIADKFNPGRHSQTMSVIPTLQQMRGSSPTLTEMDQLRQVIRRDLANSADGAEAHFGRIMIEKIDDMIDQTTPAMVVSGNAADAAPLILDARKANQVYRKSETVMMALDRAERRAAATGKGTNQDNELRKKIDNIINEKKGRTFKAMTPDEQAKMTEIVKGTKGRNAARKIGALAPTGIVSGGIGTSMGAAVGAMLGGPAGAAVGSVTIPMIGQIAKRIGDVKTAKAVDDLLRIIQSGGTARAANVGGQSLLGQNIPIGLVGGYSGTIKSRVPVGQRGR